MRPKKGLQQRKQQILDHRRDFHLVRSIERMSSTSSKRSESPVMNEIILSPLIRSPNRKSK